MYEYVWIWICRNKKKQCLTMRRWTKRNDADKKKSTLRSDSINPVDH
jgi:hypothetical protein